jgi:hypothetical protein
LRRGGHDRPAPLDEVGQGGAHDSHRAQQHVVERGDPVIVRGIVGYVAGRACQHGDAVEASQALDSLLDGRADVLAHVHGHERRSTCSEGGHRTVATLLIAPGEHEGGAVAGQDLGRRQADSGGAADDQVSLVAYVQVHGVR